MLCGGAKELKMPIADKLSYPQCRSSWNLGDFSFLRGFVPRDAESVLTAFVDQQRHAPAVEAPAPVSRPRLL
jgi:hypothetical protein